MNTPKGWKEIEAGHEQGYTALPWSIDDGIIYAENGQQAVAMVRPQRTNECPVFEHSGHHKANAQFICKAVNCHEELVEACRMMVDAYGACECTEAHKREGVPCPWCNARAVLAKARGEA